MNGPELPIKSQSVTDIVTPYYDSLECSEEYMPPANMIIRVQDMPFQNMLLWLYYFEVWALEK